MHVDPALILAEHVCGTGFTDLPAAAVTATKRDIQDTLGAMLGGSVAPGLAQLTGLVKHWGGRQESSLLLIGGMVPAPQAALINATMGHALDFDDTFDRAGNIHPGTSTLAASLAVAEMRGGASGSDFVLAVTVGLDVACRLALAATVDRGWHRTAAFGIFGATAAAGKLLRLNVAQMVDAFGIAYSQAAGTRQCIVDGALTKRLQAGQAASGPVLSAILAREGFTGAHQVFAGRFGFFPMYQPGGYDLDAITDGLGHVFRGVELSFKPYPSGRPNHAILDAALELYRRLDLSTADMGVGIDEVVITMNPQVYRDQFSPEPGKRRPSQVVEAQFSIPFLVAAALVRGKVGSLPLHQLLQPVVIEAEVVAELVLDGVLHGRFDFFTAAAYRLDGILKDGDAVGEHIAIAEPPLSQWHTLIEPQQRTVRPESHVFEQLLRRFTLHQYGDIA